MGRIHVHELCTVRLDDGFRRPMKAKEEMRKVEDRMSKAEEG